jgi:PST family polysaccharide transporter
VLQQILNLATSVVLARLLAPNDFGLLAMASVFTGMVFFVLDMGLSAALVQRQELKQQQISSVFWINVFVGLVMTLLGIASSGVLAGFYKNPGVQPVIAALSCNFLIFSLSNTQIALLTREMNFRSLELRTLVGQFIGTACAIAMAFWGFGVWSLVGRILINSGVGAILLWSVSGWRPNWKFHWVAVRELVGFSNEVFMANLLGYVGRNADNFLIGRFIGATSLGYYAMAYNAMMFPVLRFTQVLSGVLFPVLSRFQEDIEKIRRSWFRATRLIGAATIPLMLGLIILAPQFVQVVYGQKWLPAVPLLQVLAISGVNQSLVMLNATVLLSLGLTRLRLRLTILSVSLAVVSFLVGLPFGTIGVAACFTVVNTATSTLILLKTLECIGASYTQYMRNLAGVLTAGIGMSLAVLALRLGLPLAPAPMLGLAIPFGATVYLLLLRLVAPSVLSELLNFLPERLTRRWLKFS